MPNAEKYESLELLLKHQDADYQQQFESDLNRWPKTRGATAAPSKDGFMNGFLTGKISGFINTESGKKLAVERVYHSVGSNVLKSIFILRKEGGDYEVFSILYSKTGKDILCKEEWLNIFELEKQVDIEFPEAINVNIKNVAIGRNFKGNDRNFQVSVASVNLEPGKLKECKGKKLDFIQVDKHEGNFLEDDVKKLCCNDNEEPVKKYFSIIIEKIYKEYSEDHSTIMNEDYFSYQEHHGNNNIFKGEREAVQHGYTIGRFYNYKHRFNIGIYPELSGGNGLVDTVILIKGNGKENFINSIPIVIEHKATDFKLKKSDEDNFKKNHDKLLDNALKEARNYAWGFQPTGVPFLTTSRKRIYAGINLSNHPFYKMGYLETEPLSLSFMINHFNYNLKDLEDETFIRDLLFKIKKAFMSLKDVLKNCNPKKSNDEEDKCSYNDDNHRSYLIANIVTFLYGHVSSISQFENNNGEYIGIAKHLFVCPHDDAIVYYPMFRSGIILSEDVDDPKRIVIIDLIDKCLSKETCPSQKECLSTKDKKYLPLNKLYKSLQNTDIIENKISTYLLGNSKHLDEDESVNMNKIQLEINKFDGFSEYKKKNNDKSEKCEFIKIPSPEKMKDSFIKAMCMLKKGEEKEIFKSFDQLFNDMYPIFDTNYLRVSLEARWQYILFGIIYSYGNLLKDNMVKDCNIQNIEVMIEYQMGYNDGVIDLLIKPVPEGTPIFIEIKRRNKHHSNLKEIEKSCDDSLNKYKHGTSYREITHGKEMMLAGYICDAKDKRIKPCNANNKDNVGKIINKRSINSHEFNFGIFKNSSISMESYDYPRHSSLLGIDTTVSDTQLKNISSLHVKSAFASSAQRHPRNLRQLPDIEAVPSSASRPKPFFTRIVTLLSWLSNQWLPHILEQSNWFTVQNPVNKNEISKTNQLKNKYIWSTCVLWTVTGQDYTDGLTCHSNTRYPGRMMVFPIRGDICLNYSNLSEENYRNCRLVEFNGRPSAYCQGEWTHVIFTTEIPGDSLSYLNAQLMLMKVFRIDKLIANFLELRGIHKQQKPASKSLPNKQATTNEQRIEWRNQLDKLKKNVKDLFEQLTWEGKTVDKRNEWPKWWLEDLQEQYGRFTQVDQASQEEIEVFEEKLQATLNELDEILRPSAVPPGEKKHAGQSFHKTDTTNPKPKPAEDLDDINILCSENSDIISAIKNNDLTRVRSYIEENKNVNARSKGGRPLIMVAVENNCRTELVKLLINNGADINSEDPDGESAINLSAYNGNYKLIKLLIFEGAIIKNKTEKNSPFISVAESCLPKITKDQVIKLLTEGKCIDKISNSAVLTRNLVQQVLAMHSSIVDNPLTSRSYSNPDPVYSSRVSGLLPMSSQ